MYCFCSFIAYNIFPCPLFPKRVPALGIPFLRGDWVHFNHISDALSDWLVSDGTFPLCYKTLASGEKPQTFVCFHL